MNIETIKKLSNITPYVEFFDNPWIVNVEDSFLGIYQELPDESYRDCVMEIESVIRQEDLVFINVYKTGGGTGVMVFLESEEIKSE